MSGHTLSLPLSARIGPDGSSLVVRSRPIAVALTFMTAAALMGLSGATLDLFGVPYGSPGGSALLKIHPASYLSLMALLFWIAADGGLAPFLGRTWIESPGLLAFLFAVVLFAFQTMVQKTPISQVADNFVLALALFIGLLRLDAAERRRLWLLLQWFFLLNSLIGYAEVVFGFHMVPLYEKGQLATYDWRARALLGHPLNNALMTALYVVTLALGYGPRRRWLRLALLALDVGALVCFGGRTSTVMALAALVLIGAFEFAKVLAGRRVRPENVAVGVAVVTVAAIALFFAVDLGLFDRFLMRFVDDSGSASTRVAMLSIFRDLPLSEVLIAPNQTTIHVTQLRLNLAIAIESAFVGFVAYFGGIVTFGVMAGLAAYFSELFRRFGAVVGLPLVIYVVVSSSATSISTKSVEVAMVTLILYLQFAEPASGDRRREPAC
jgi:hypothetical protein